MVELWAGEYEYRRTVFDWAVFDWAVFDWAVLDGATLDGAAWLTVRDGL